MGLQKDILIIFKMKFQILEIDEEKNNEIKKEIKKMSNDENEGGFVSHLTELRKRLIT